MEFWTNASYAAGLVLGSLLILTVIALAFKNRKVGVGESFLVVMGVFMISFTLWARVKISFGPEGWQAEFERMQKQVETLRTANLNLNEQIETIAVANEIERGQIVALTEVLQERRIVNPESLEMIRGNLSRAPTVNRDMLHSERELMKRPPG
jgi:hypothetical protein